MIQTCDCLDAWRLQAPSRTSLANNEMICEVCGFFIESGPSRPITPQLKSSPRASQLVTPQLDSSCELLPLITSSTPQTTSNTTPPQTPLDMDSSGQIFFPTVPPSSEQPVRRILQDSNSASNDERVGTPVKHPQFSLVSPVRSFPPPRRKSGGGDSTIASTTPKVKDKTARRSSVWSKLCEQNAPGSGMSLPRRNLTASKTPTRRRQQALNVEILKPSELNEHITRFEKKPSDGYLSKYTSHCSIQLKQPGPPVSTTGLDDKLFILGYQKERAESPKKMRSPKVGSTVPVGKPFNLSISPLVSPLPMSFIPDVPIVMGNPSKDCIRRVSSNNSPQNSKKRLESYWALDYGTEETLRVSTAATVRLGSSCGGSRGGGGDSRSGELDGNSFMSLNTLSTSWSFRSRNYNEVPSSGYAHFRKQHPRNNLLWPTADPDGSRKPIPSRARPTN